MKFSDGSVVITRTDPHRTKYASARAEVLAWWAMDGMFDHASGDAECPTGWFLHYQRDILRGDDRGFVWTETFKDEQAAHDVYNALDRVYGEWSYDEWDDGNEEARTEEEQFAALERAWDYVAYCYVNAENNLECYPFDEWLAQGEPKGYLA